MRFENVPCFVPKVEQQHNFFAWPISQFCHFEAIKSELKRQRKGTPPLYFGNETKYGPCQLAKASIQIISIIVLTQFKKVY